LQPLLLVVVPIVRYDEFRLPARESAYMLVTSIDAWWRLFVAAFGIWCGVAVWQRRDGAANAVKVYLVTCLLTAVSLIALPVLVPFESFLRKPIHLEQAFLFVQMLAVFVIGCAVFNFAAGIRSIFGAVSPSGAERWRPAQFLVSGAVMAGIVLGSACSIAAFYRAPLNVFQAAWNGDLKALQHFVANGVDVNTSAANHDTPLHLAATRDIAEYLIGTTSAMESAYLLKPEDIKNVRVLIGKLRDPIDPLSHMLRERLSQPARDILQNPAVLSDDDLTVMIVKELNRILGENIVVDLREVAGVKLSPATLALAAQDPVGVRRLDLNRHLLEESFPDAIAKYQIDARNLLHETPLHMAAFNGRADVAGALVSRGAYLDAANRYHWTPLDYALLARKKNRGGNVDGVIALLVNHGATANVPQHQLMLRHIARVR
jgi:ankyrin repeat protein